MHSTEVPALSDLAATDLLAPDLRAPDLSAAALAASDLAAADRAASGLPWGAPRACCRVDVVEPGRMVALSGRLDVSVAADIRLALVAAADDGTGELVLDLRGLASLDATGLGVLVGTHRRAQRAGRVLVLADVTPAVARLLFLTRLDKVLRTRRSAA